MKGSVIEKREVARGTLQVVFELPQPVSFKPGQYFFVNLPVGRKQFSINNSPNQNHLLTLTTRLTGSDFKNALNELPIGSEVELGPIAGEFSLPEDTSRPLVFIAGGIGITPCMSMFRFLKETANPYQITLIYSNRNQASTAFLNEVSDFKFIKLILTMTDDPNWSGEKRKVDAKFINDYCPKSNSYHYMVVGPTAMVDAVRKALEDAGVSNENIKFENFTGY